MLADLYERACSTPSDIWEHLPTFVELCAALDARKVVELGVRTGVSTIAWLHGLEHTGGHLWSVDISEPPEIPGAARWTFLQGDDRDPSIIAALPADVDIVFIDTSHTYAHTLQELALYTPRVRKGGRIVLHDTEVEHPDGTTDTDYPVRRAVELFCEANGLAWTNYPNCNGLAIVEVT